MGRVSEGLLPPISPRPPPRTWFFPSTLKAAGAKPTPRLGSCKGFSTPGAGDWAGQGCRCRRSWTTWAGWGWGAVGGGPQSSTSTRHTQEALLRVWAGLELPDSPELGEGGRVAGRGRSILWGLLAPHTSGPTSEPDFVGSCAGVC